MTLSTSGNVSTYTGDNSTVEFSFPYLVFAEADLAITLDGVATSAWSAATYGAAGGVTVTFDTAPGTGVAIIIKRSVPNTQATDFSNFDGNPADVTEKALDYLAMGIQDQDERVNRCLILPISHGITSTELTGTATTTAQALTITTSGIAISTLGSFGDDIDTSFSSLASGDLMKYDGSNWANVTQASLGLLTDVVSDTTPQLGGFLDPNGKYIGMDKGGDIASASPLVIDTDGDYFDVTGTTGFSAMTVAANRFFTLHFDGALTMTHGASLDLPGAANITTAAGDQAIFFATAADTVRCVSYTKNDGTAVVGGSAGLTLITASTASNDTSIDFTSGIDSTYDEYIIKIIDMVPASDAQCYMRTSTDTGSTFDNGATDYEYAVAGVASSSASAVTAVSTGDTEIWISGNQSVGSAAGESLNSTIHLFKPSGTNQTFVYFDSVLHNGTTVPHHFNGVGVRSAAEDVDAIRFLMSTGNITSGEFKLYGVKKS